MDRVLDRLEQLYAISADAHRRLARGGRRAPARRPLDARGRARGRGRRAPATRSGAAATRRVWIGSHLDSVPDGGRFDGVLGVVAGHRAGRPARRPARRRRLPRRGARLRRQQRVRRRRPLPEAYLELHVEQGPVLERANEPIGIVTAVAGIARGEVVFEGRADHAGTTPMDARDDALAPRRRVRAPRAARAVARHRRDRRPHARRARRRQRRARRASPSRSRRAPPTGPSSTGSSPRSASSRSTSPSPRR